MLIDLNAKVKQFLICSSIGFCLVMFSPNFVAAATLDLSDPPSIIIGVTTVTVSLHLIAALLLMLLGMVKAGQNEPSLEIFRMAMLISVAGIGFALISFQLNSPLVNSISFVTIVFNTGTLLASFFATFAIKE